MFKANFVDLREKIDMPYNVMSTSSVFDKVTKTTNFKNDELLLQYNSININSSSSYHLTDIGFCPEDTLNVKLNRMFTGKFKIIPYKFIIDYDFDMCESVFNIKKKFASDFFTVPQNIIIYFNGSQLPDNLLIHEKINPDIPFEVNVEEGYSLYYTFYGEFQYICMSNDSTLENLQDSISSHFTKHDSIIKPFLSKQKENNQKLLQELSKTIKLFEFEEENLEIPKNEGNTKYFPFNIVVSIPDYQKNLDCILIKETNVYSIKSYLEKHYGIDRRLFSVYDKKGYELDNDSVVNNHKNYDLVVKIKDQLNVKINNKIKTLSYFSTLDYIKKEFHFDKNNFGIIINNQFANPRDKIPLLIKYLNNSKNDRSMTDIKIINSRHSCHVKSFIKSSDYKNHSKKYSRFLIPDDMKLSEIAIKYFGSNCDSYKFYDKGNDIYCYEETTQRNIHFDFIGSQNEKWQYKFQLTNRDLTIHDLFIKLLNYRTEHISCKNFKYAAFLNKKPLSISSSLSSIPYDERNLITITETKSKEEEEVSIKNLTNNKEIRFTFNPNCTAQEILRKLNLFDQKLFLNFKYLSSDDIPYMCFLKNCFLSTTPILSKNTFRVSNGLLEIPLHLESKDYDYLPYQIKIMFGLIYEEVKFIFKCEDGKDYELPTDFHARSLPKNPLIIIDYTVKNANQILVNYITDKLVPIPNLNYKISKCKYHIMKAFNLYKYSINAMQLVFYDDIELSSEKSFSDYKITPRMQLKIKQSKDSISIEISISDQIFMKQYYFAENETIGDLKDHLKEQFNLGNKNDISVKNLDDTNLDDKKPIKKEMYLKISTRPVKIQYQGHPKDEEFLIDSIASAEQAGRLIDKKILGTNQRTIYLFTYNNEEKSFEVVDETKILKDIPEQIYAHRIIPSIEFGGYSMRFTGDNKISEFNSLSYFKTHFISKQVMTTPDKFFITQSEQKIDESTPMKKLCRGIQMKIRFEGVKSTNSLKNIEIMTHKRQSVIRKNFKPVIKQIAETPEKPKFKKNYDEEDEVENEEERTKVHEKPKKIKPPEEDDNEYNRKSNRRKSNRGGDDHNKESPPRNVKSEFYKTNRRKIELKDDDDQTDFNVQIKSKLTRPTNSEITDEEERSQKQNKLKPDEKVESNNKNKNSKRKRFSYDKSSDDDDDSQNENANQNDSFELMEEENRSDEENGSDEIECTFQIARNEPFKMKVKNSDTIEDVKILLSKRQGEIDSDTISVVFAGKKLKKNLIIRTLNLQQDDILQVFIFTPQTILLKSAKCFSTHGVEEFEYYSEYEEEEEEEEKNESIKPKK